MGMLFPMSNETTHNGRHPFLSERWQLMRLSREDLARIGFFSIIIGLLFAMFHLLGNTVAAVPSRSAFVWMTNRWNDPISFGADYSHGWLIPLVSLGVIWYKRRDLLNAPKAMSQVGLAVVILALILHWIGAKIQQPRLSLAALILLLWGVPYYFFGWQVAKILIFPCSYLIFCIPLNFLDALAFPLRMVSTVMSTSLLNGLGIAAERSSTAIKSAAAGGFEFDVADPCSGLRSLLAMTALTAVYAYFTQKTLLKKWLLFAASIPLAVIGNIARVTTVALVAEAFGQPMALGLYHDYSGYVIFGVAIALMIGIGSLLDLNYREVWKRWKVALLSPT